jgi:hypothetical protein
VGNAINIPDKRLLFCGDVQRLDSDLKLVGRDGHNFTIPSYFEEAERRPLISPEGAALPGNVVDLLARRLTGSSPLGSKVQLDGLPIGTVKIVHKAFFLRNSTVGPLSIGSPIFREDIIRTDSEGEVGVALADQTVFVLQKASRIAIEKFQFDEGQNEHFSVFTLISGTAAFVPGRVANAGNMQIVTPVAIFAIRGETGKGVLKVSFDAREPGAIPQSEITIFPNSDGPPGKVDVFSFEGGLVGSLITNVIKSTRLGVEAHKILKQRKLQTSEPAQAPEPELEPEPSLEQAHEPEPTPELRQISEPAQAPRARAGARAELGAGPRAGADARAAANVRAFASTGAGARAEAGARAGADASAAARNRLCWSERRSEFQRALGRSKRSLCRRGRSFYRAVFI